MSDNVTDITNRILIDIRDELRGQSARLDRTNAELVGLNRRVDNLVELAGGAHRDHEQRIARLESQMTKPRGSRS